MYSILAGFALLFLICGAFISCEVIAETKQEKEARVLSIVLMVLAIITNLIIFFI